MIANILLAAYLILMTYYWGMVQGAFSALLHLVVTIIAGGLALALWQPLVLGFLIHRMPEYAWGVGLVGPFILLLIGLRAGMDRLIRGNVQFAQWINGVVGGFFGLMAAILTSGLVLIGVQFLPLSDAILGYIPLSVTETGKVQRNSGALWVAVTEHASNAFTMLSGGSMAPGFPAANGVSIEHNVGDLALQSELFHLREQYDPHTSVAAHPAEVTVTQAVASSPASLNLSAVQSRAVDAAGVTGNRQLIIIDTKWQDDRRGTYIKGALNLVPTQVRLITRRTTGGSTQSVVHAPIGVGVRQVVDSTRQFVGFNDNTSFARVTDPPANLAFGFVVPDGETPTFLLVRNLPLAVPEVKRGEAEMVAMLGRAGGTLLTSVDPPPNTGTVNPPQNGNTTVEVKGLALTPELPTPFSENVRGNLRITNKEVVSGTENVKRIPGIPMTDATRVSNIQVPPHLASVRLKVDRQQAQSIFGRAISAARMVEPIFLMDSQTSGQHLPLGYVVLHPDGSMDISIDLDTPLRSARQTPIAKLNEGDELYLYFMVPRGRKIVSFHLGSTVKQDVNLDIPK